jgi:plastocyanin
MEPTTPPVTEPKSRPLWLSGLAIIVVIVAAIVIVAVTERSQTSKTTKPNTEVVPARVTITPQGFVPATLTIRQGQAVVWTNSDSATHQVDSDPYPSNNYLTDFNELQPMPYNGQFSFIFNKIGSYTYHDNLNPYRLKGTIVVK